MKKNISIIFFANFFMLLSGVATSLLTAWSLGAEGRGDLAVVVLYPNVVALLLGFGLAQANRFFLAAEPEEVSPIFSNTVIFAAVMGVLAFGLAELVVPSLVGARSEAVMWMVKLYLINIPLALLYDVMAGMLEGSRRFKWIAFARILFFGIQAAVYFLLWISSELTVFSAAVTMIAAQLANTSAAVIGVFFALKPSWKPHWATWKKTINYGLKYHVGSVTSFTTLRLDQLLLGGMATNLEIGLYVIAVRLSEITTVLASSVAEVLMPEIAAAKENDRSTKLLTRSIRQMFAVYLVAIIPALLIAPWLLEFAFGAEFVAAGNTLRILLVASMMWSVGGIVISGLNGFGYPGLSTIARLSSAIVTVFALLYWLPKYGIEGAALASLFGYSVMLAVALFWLLQKKNIRLGEIFRPRLEDFPIKKIMSIFKSRFAPKAEINCFHQLFEHQAAIQPDRAAIICNERHLTYGELNARANQLAWYLRSKGAKPETLIPVCVDRSPEMAIGILGILKSGAAFVPIDPAYPADRIEFMLADTTAPFIVTKSNLLPSASAEKVLLDADWEKISQNPTDNPPTIAEPENLAYVIYTSGSTGKPKGAMLTQANLKHYVEALQAEFCLTADDRYLHLASIAFSSARRHLLFPLAHGASVVIADEELRMDALPLFKLIKKQAVTVFDAVPSFQRFCLNALLELETAERNELLNNNLRLIVSASEPLLSDIPAVWMNEFWHPAEHLHMIGQTETSGIISLNRIGKADVAGAVKAVPVGNPIANTKIYLLDENQQPVADGEAGEIYVHGNGLGRGYLNLPELTAQKIVEITLADGTTQKVCRTGDFARILPDGRMECLGRQDFQIKIRGNRVELGEIEALLISHPNVKECSVIGREDVPGQIRLAAYLVPRNDSESLIDELRTLTKNELPDYMQPSAFVILDALPLTPNGKIDRKNLPRPDESAFAAEKDYIAPNNQTEAKIAEIYAEVLGLNQVGTTANFFDLGGHSLLATQAVARVRKAFKIEIPISSIFENPTVAELAEKVGFYQPTEKNPADELGKIEKPVNLPLSFAQQRLWFLAQMEGDSAAYNMSETVRLEGDLDAGLLHSALKKIVARHEILRTSFIATAGKPFQVIGSANGFEFSCADITYFSADEKEAVAQKIVAEFAAKPFDLTTAPLLRAKLITLDENEHLLQIVFHHIISDGWSVGLFLKELGEFYQGNLLPELPIQYSDYSIWQQKWRKTDDYQQQLEFWKNQLQDAPPLLELATDFPRPSVQRYQGNQLSAFVSSDLTDKIYAFSRQQGVTPFMTLLSAWQLLMWRYSGQEQVVIGTPIAGRTKTEIENLIGFFVNTLAIKGDLSGNPTFTELLQRTKTITLGAYTNQDLPFEKLVEELNPERSLSYSPIFQVMFAFQNLSATENKLGDLNLSRVKLPSQSAKFDLSLDVFEETNGLEFQLEYDVDLFTLETVQQMLGNFQTILESVVGNPENSLSKVEFLTEGEMQQLLIGWNDNQVEIPSVCMHHLIEKHAAQTPNKTAVVWNNERLTYGELNAKANQLAHFLQKQGVKPDDIIGVCMERSLEMIVGILGVLKAGGAYLPLDPNYPAERLQYMTNDAGVSILVTQESLREKAADFDLQKIISHDADWSLIANEPAQNPESAVTPDNLTYITFTSGSTGKSKGALMTHRNVVNIFAAWEKDYHLSTIESHLQMANFSFDVFTGDVIRALCNGKKLVLCPTELLLESDKLEELIRNENIEAAEFVPAVIRPMIEYLEESGKRLDFMKMLVVGADVWQMAEYRRLKRLCGEQTRVISSYGVTEATIDSTYFEMTEKHLKDEGIVPIGRPFANTQIYLLDPQQNLIPAGVPGELYLGGDGLARGYLNRPELTKERFIEWISPTGELKKLYRTGDIARYRRDGVIEIIGRADHQVKIRGYRIELGEIETVLSNHTEINECVVVAREDVPGDKRLVAYLTIKGEEINAGELRRYIKELLPEYMIPTAFVVVKEWKLSPNGKIDRKQLPAPAGDYIKPETEYIAPRTPLEEKMAEIWANLLRQDRVGINDNFFDLGGHSLLATQVVSRFRDVFGKQIPLRLLFETPTIARLAEQIITLNGAIDSENSLYHKSDYLEPPLSCAQQRLWFLDQFDFGNSVYNLPAVWKIEGEVQPQMLEKSINEVIARHEILRMTFTLSDEQPVQLIAESRHLPLEIAELKAAADFENFVQSEISQTFDLLNGALLRATLIRQDGTEHLLLVFHHSISDGWSIGLFLKELSEFYQAHLSDTSAALPDLPIQYSDYALWQQDWLKTDEYRQQLEFWKSQLADVSPLLDLATDFPRPSVQRYQGNQLSAVVSSDLTDKIYAFSRQQGVTPFMTLLSAWQLLMWRYSGQEQIVVGTPIAGRTRTETENLIGLFINTLAIKGDLSGNPTFTELLQRTKTITLGAYTNQDLPFEKLVEELNPERSLSYSPIFQVMFAFQNSAAAQEKLGDLPLERVKLPSQSAKFDLSLDVFEETGGLTLWIEYDTELFTAETAEKMLVQYQNILNALIYRSAGRLSEMVEFDVRQTEFTAISAKQIAASDFIPLRTPTEKFVAQIWSNLLSQKEIGGKSDFFDLGGHSLLALKVVIRLRAHFDLEIPLRKIFEHSTVESLSAKIDQMQSEKETAELERLLAELENFSEEEAQRLIAQQSNSAYALQK